MNDFLYNNYSFLYRLFIGISVVSGLLCYKKYKNTSVRYFIWFLIYIFLFELLASYTSYVQKFEFLHGFKDYLEGTLFEKNYWLYNFFWNIVSTLFLSFYYLKNLKIRAYRLTIRMITSVFILFCLIYIPFNSVDFFTTSAIPLKLIAGIVILFNIIFYLIEILNGEKILTFYKSFNFYVSAALFVWWLVTTPVVFYQIYFSSADWNFIFLRWQIYLFMNLFMYFTFAFAFIWCKPEYDNPLPEYVSNTGLL